MPEIPEITAEVVKEVKKGIETIGALSKENKEEIGKVNELFKQVLEKQGDEDPITKERLDKIAADVSTRHEAMDNAQAAVTERLDAIEVAAKRIGSFSSTGNMEQDRKMIEEYMQFEKSLIAASQVKRNFKDILQMQKQPNQEKLSNKLNTKSGRQV